MLPLIVVMQSRHHTKSMKELLTNLLQVIGLAWWVEIITDRPQCTYYFGPFLSENEAIAAKSGYLEDLEQEGAQGIQVRVKRCKPNNLTIYDESGELFDRKTQPNLSGQSY